MFSLPFPCCYYKGGSGKRKEQNQKSSVWVTCFKAQDCCTKEPSRKRNRLLFCTSFIFTCLKPQRYASLQLFNTIPSSVKPCLVKSGLVQLNINTFPQFHLARITKFTQVLYKMAVLFYRPGNVCCSLASPRFIRKSKSTPLASTVSTPQKRNSGVEGWALADLKVPLLKSLPGCFRLWRSQRNLSTFGHIAIGQTYVMFVCIEVKIDGRIYLPNTLMLYGNFFVAQPTHILFETVHEM